MKFYRVLALGAMAILVGGSTLGAQSHRERGFSDAVLNGCYGAREQGDGAVAAGLGVVCYDGAGNTTRSLRVNAPDGAGGRRILTFTSEGEYEVHPDGTATATYTNIISEGESTTTTFDLVILGVAPSWTPGRGPRQIATELFAAQREAGVTVSLVTSIQKRIGSVVE